jgi:hypothetical protein
LYRGRVANHTRQLRQSFQLLVPASTTCDLGMSKLAIQQEEDTFLDWSLGACGLRGEVGGCGGGM